MSKIDSQNSMKSYSYIFSILILCLLFSQSYTLAQQIPVKSFSVNEGLAANSVYGVYNDSRGFMWFGTSSGLSRFDGYNFDVYDERNGLPNSAITGFLEDENGVYWVATYGGLCRIDFDSPLDKDGKLSIQIIKFGDRIQDNQIIDLFRDTEENIWIGTGTGLFKVVKNDEKFLSERIDLKFPERKKTTFPVKSIAEDEFGNLWLSTREGLLRHNKNGEVKQFIFDVNLRLEDMLADSMIDDRGLLWINSLSGIFVLKPTSDDEFTKIKRNVGEMILPENAGDYVHFTKADGIGTYSTEEKKGDRTFDVFQTSDRNIWIATHAGATVFDGKSFYTYKTENNLTAESVHSIGEDRIGNIWLGTQTAGLMRIANNGLTSYTQKDGLPYRNAYSVFAGSDGEIYANTGGGGEFISRFNGRGLDTIRPNFPAYIKGFSWASNHSVIQTKNGEWWFPTSSGVVRFPAVSSIEDLQNTTPIEVFDMSDGLPSNEVFRLYEDKNGDVWISLIVPPKVGLALWKRQSGELEIFEEDDIKFVSANSARAFAEDENNNLWIGFYYGELAGFKDGEFEVFDYSETLGKENIYDLHFDKSGKLWIAADNGVFFIENPIAEKPLINKLSADIPHGRVTAITDDLEGNLYFGTSKGIAKFDPQTNKTAIFTTADGLVGTYIHSAFCDKKGVLWFGTRSGLTRFDTTKLSTNETPPTILVRSFKIGGENYPISELGAKSLENLTLQSNQSSVEIEVVGLTQKSGDILSYQYKLHSEDDWSEPTEQRIFNFAQLDSGDYVFQIRATNSAGLVSSKTANVNFSVLAPFYMRPWFLTFLVLLICGIAYLIYRYRLRKMLEVEKVRLNIATDLHDDIGSTLSQISLISEVLSKKQNGFHSDEKRSLETIAETSRSAVNSMSEMVWAIDPKRDSLRDLIFKMRRFASDTLSAADIKFTFKTLDLSENIKVEPDTRRQIYLMFKEIINNAAKHSDCENMSIEFERKSGSFYLKIEDDGKGFDTAEEFEGNGLNNIKHRAKEIGGNVEISSEVRKGTTIIVEIPAKFSIFPKIST